jgi:hypothetical protein
LQGFIFLIKSKSGGFPPLKDSVLLSAITTKGMKELLSAEKFCGVLTDELGKAPHLEP